MFLTITSGLCLVILGLGGFFGWERMGAEGSPAEMLMPVFFGGALIICVAFARKHFRHGLYGGMIIALLGIVSAVVRLYQYEGLQSFQLPKTHIILAMGAICIMQMLISWREVQKDRNDVAPPI
ncbi:MAG: hypothetical protein AB8F34_02250 [Akkermansiaceae bacterium]